MRAVLRWLRPTTDRNEELGTLRWRIWMPFHVAGYVYGVGEPIWLAVILNFAALSLALWWTRRRVVRVRINVGRHSVRLTTSDAEATRILNDWNKPA